MLEVLLHARQVKTGEDRREEHVRPLPIDGYQPEKWRSRSISPVFTRPFFAVGSSSFDEFRLLIRQKTRNTFTHPTIDSRISAVSERQQSRISESMKRPEGLDITVKKLPDSSD